jgi:hypothetical protein
LTSSLRDEVLKRMLNTPPKKHKDESGVPSHKSEAAKPTMPKANKNNDTP